jgi:hypothetical protein
MRDDREFVKKSLGRLGLTPHREEEIARELSEHLADHAVALEARGLDKDAAAREAQDSVSNWPELGRKILAAEIEGTTMNYRTRVLWLPALFALTLSYVLLALIQIFGPQPSFYWFFTGRSLMPFVAFIVPWLLSQPVVGAIAAFWSRRAGGTVRYQILAALAPAIALLGLFLLILPFAMIVVHHVSHTMRIGSFLGLTVTWVILPALPLLLGAAPFLRTAQSRSV